MLEPEKGIGDKDTKRLQIALDGNAIYRNSLFV